MDVVLKIFGVSILILAILRLKYILKEKDKSNFFYNHRYSIHAIVISIIFGIYTIVEIIKQFLTWFK